MSCAIEAKVKLIIEHDEKGCEEWEEGEDISLELVDGDVYCGEIKEILATELTIKLENKNTKTISFDDIEGYI